jgi:hypothetical protein
MKLRTKQGFIILIAVCLMLTVGCIKPTEPADEMTQRPAEEIDLDSLDSGSNDSNSEPLVIGGDDIFNRSYIDVVYNVWYATEIVGTDIIDEWKQEVYFKQDLDTISKLPTLYQAIRDLSIPKKDFLELNASFREKGIEWMMIPGYVLEALYLGDENAMKKILIHPLAFYYNGDVYTIDELRTMSAKEIKNTGIPKKDLEEFTDKIELIMLENVGESSYESSYKGSLDQIREKIKE